MFYAPIVLFFKQMIIIDCDNSLLREIGGKNYIGDSVADIIHLTFWPSRDNRVEGTQWA